MGSPPCAPSFLQFPPQMDEVFIPSIFLSWIFRSSLKSARAARVEIFLLNPGRIHNKGKASLSNQYWNTASTRLAAFPSCRVRSTDLRARISAASELRFCYVRTYFLVVWYREKKQRDIHQVSVFYFNFIFFLSFFCLCSTCRLSVSTSFMSPRTHRGPNCLDCRECDLQFYYPCRFYTTTSECLVSLVYLDIVSPLSIYSVTLVYLEVVGKNFLRLPAWHTSLSLVNSCEDVGKRTKQIDQSVKLIIGSCLAEPRKSNKYHHHGGCYFWLGVDIIAVDLRGYSSQIIIRQNNSRKIVSIEWKR